MTFVFFSTSRFRGDMKQQHAVFNMTLRLSFDFKELKHILDHDSFHGNFLRIVKED